MVVEPVLKLKGLSVPQWAEKAGVNQAVAYDYLNGKSDPRPANRKALAEALGLDAEDLPG
jgi:transcriptional regulator with XRE-family HTH domain